MSCLFYLVQKIIKQNILYMRFSVSNTVLLAHLQSISRVIASKNAIAILDNFLFELNDGRMKITASDSETTMETFVNVIESDSNGAFTISGKSMLDVLKEIPEQPITINVNTETFEMKIEYMNGELNLIGQNPLEYPKTPQLVKSEDLVEVTIPSSVLYTGLNRTAFASDDNDYHPTMNGVYFDFAKDDLTVVATNGHILVRFKTTQVQSEGKSAFILPKKPVAMLKNVLPKEDCDVKVSFNGRNAVFVLSEYVMTCRLTEGRFPNYNAVIPTNTPNKVSVDRNMFLGALKRVSICSMQSGGLVKLSLNLDNTITVYGQDTDFSSSAEERVPCTYEGVQMEIGFSSSFLIDIISNLPSEEVVIELMDQSRAGVITPGTQEENEDLLMLLTPMML